MAARNRPVSAAVTKLSQVHRDHIQASMLLRRVPSFVGIDPDRPRPDDVRMTRTQVHVALALLRKVLPDLASVEVSGNPEKPLMVQVVRFSDGEQLEAPRPVLDMSRLIEMDKTETAAIEAEAGEKPRKNGRADRG
jgi:hypothetical protein